jgi:peptidoglycan hydrolase-like protein with peptidoglycan-binding domain
MGKIKDEKGRESLEEFADDTYFARSGTRTPAPGSDEAALTDASNNYPTDDEKQDVGPSDRAATPGDYRLPDTSGIPVNDLREKTSVPDFKFLECDPIDFSGVVECPLCRENEYAYVPDYRLMENGDIFFDGKRCYQSLVLTDQSPVFDGPTVTDLKDEDYQKEKKQEAIKLMLQYFNKSEVATVYYYVKQPPSKDDLKTGLSATLTLGAAVAGGVLGASTANLLGKTPEGTILAATLGVGLGTLAATGAGVLGGVAIPDPIRGYDLVKEERNVVNELLPYAKFEYSIPIQKTARTRILVSVPVEYLERVPTRAIAEPDTKFESDLEATILGKDFFPMFRRSIRAMRVYQNQLDNWYTNEGGKLVKVREKTSSRLNLRDEAAYLAEFRDQINAFIKDQGLSFKGFNQIEKITFKFEETGTDSIALRQIEFNKPGCENIRVGKGGKYSKLFQDLTAYSPMQRSTTLYYVGALPEMDLVLTARSPMPWLEFVTTFTFPSVEVLFGANGNNVLSDPTVLECLGDRLGENSVGQFLDQLENIGLSIPDAILAKIKEGTCKTREEVQEEDNELNGIEGEGKSKGDETVYAGMGTEKQIARENRKAERKAARTERKDIRKDAKEARKAKRKKEREREKAERRLRLEKEDPYLFIVVEEIEAEIAKRKQFRSDFKLQKDSPISYKRRKYKRNSRRADRDAKELFFQRLNDRLKWCGWLALATKAADCVAQGIGEETAIGLLTEAAFKSMSDAHLERVFAGLPPEEQQKVFDTLAEDVKGLPAPWDTNYIGGSYSGPGFSLAGGPPDTNPTSLKNREEELRKREANEILESLGIEPDPDANLDEIYEEIGKESTEALDQLIGTSTTPPPVEPGENPAASYEDWINSDDVFNLELGSTGDDVQVVEESLLFLGYDINVDREFTPASVEVLNQFQRDNNLTETDYVDSNTLQFIRSAVDKRIQDIRDAQPTAGDAPVRSRTANDPGIFGIGYSEGNFSFGGVGSDNPGSGGTYGQALAGFNKAIVDAYRNAMLKSVGADVLLNELNKLPGAPIIASFIKNIPCKPNPPWAKDPRIDNFMSTLVVGFEAETCKWDFDLTTPQGVLPDEAGYNIFTLIYEAAKEAFQEAITAAIMAATKLILQRIGQIACDAIGTLGASLLDLYDGNDHFRDLLKQNLCPDASDDALHAALIDIFSVFADNERSCLETLTNSEMGDFIDDLSVMLTQAQIVQLISGTATAETLTLAVEVAKVSGSECIKEIFSDPDAFTTFFPGLEIFLPDDYSDVLDGDLDRPVFPCSDETANQISDIRCDLLGFKGLTPEECREQLDDIKDKAVQDLADIANIINNGPLADVPPILGDETCPADGIYNTNDPVLSDVAGQVASLLFTPIEEGHIRDLMSPINFFTGHGGVLNAILADTKGRPWKKHNWMVRHFGSPNSADLGFFEFASDNAIKDPDSGTFEPAPMDVYGSKLSGREGKGNSFFGRSTGGFPPTVGAHMAHELLKLEPEFKTKITPTGYANVSDALDDFDQKFNTNNTRVQRRKEYVEAFIDEFDLENKKTWAAKFAQAASDLRNGVQSKLFGDDLDKNDLKFKNYTPEDRALRVLQGKDISIAGQSIGKDPKKWSSKNKRAAGTNGKTFVDFYGGQARLLDLPDTSSADIQLDFKTYKDEDADPTPNFEFSLQYDYNLFDDDGDLIPDNNYRVKVVETHRSPSGGSPKLRRQLKRQGSDVPPKSLLDEEDYSFTSYDLKMPSSRTIELQQFIDTLEVSDEIKDSYQIEHIFRYFERIITDATDRNLTDEEKTSLRKYFSDSNFDMISGSFLKRIANIISTGRVDLSPETGSEDEPSDSFMQPDVLEDQNRRERKNHEEIGLEYIAPGFLFGYDPFKEPEIIYLDNETYGGVLGKLFPDKVPPPFYVQEQRYAGWMDIAQALVPEVDGCEPARRHLLDLKPLAQQSAQLGTSLLQDYRLDFDPLCSQESPFDRIMSASDAGKIDGAIRAVIRIYVLDVFLRAVPVFTQFGLSDANYDGLLQTFVAERMRQGLLTDGTPATGTQDEEYYHRFLEQCVNTIVRKADAGLIKVDEVSDDWSQEEYVALNNIIQSVDRFYTRNDGELAALSNAAISGQSIIQRAISPKASSRTVNIGSGSAKFSKTAAKIAKKMAFEEMIRENEEDALIILKRFIREEFEVIKNDFDQRIPAAVR